MIAATVTMGVAACSDDSDSAPSVPMASSSAAQSGQAQGGDSLTNPNQRPDVKSLNDMLNKALDANVPNSQKTQLVQNSEKDPQIFDKLVKAKTDNPDANYQIYPPVLAAGPNRASVKVQVKLPDNPPSKVDAQIVFDKGRWKLASQTVCPILSFQKIKSPMCPAQPAGSNAPQ